MARIRQRSLENIERLRQEVMQNDDLGAFMILFYWLIGPEEIDDSKAEYLKDKDYVELAVKIEEELRENKTELIKKAYVLTHHRKLYMWIYEAELRENSLTDPILQTPTEVPCPIGSEER